MGVEMDWMFPPTITNPWGESKFNLSCLTVLDQFFTSQASSPTKPSPASFTLLKALGLRWWKRWRNDHRTLSDTWKTTSGGQGTWDSGRATPAHHRSPPSLPGKWCQNVLFFPTRHVKSCQEILWCWKILEHWKSLKTSWISLKGTSDTSVWLLVQHGFARNVGRPSFFGFWGPHHGRFQRATVGSGSHLETTAARGPGKLS